ncbi:MULTISPECIES: hypothetical protein [Streptomyces]|uniref:hypothetical protein n=1 Tax=Streptomyces TaxID=1883 RepID=UPI000B9EDAB2|nr:hypothetical protein [Streptomyces kasugaensis]
MHQPGTLLRATSGETVPYITLWSEETDWSPEELCLTHEGLHYRYDDDADRDAHGVLWSRSRGMPGFSRPQFRRVSSERQRTCMRDLRCQVCAGPASTTQKGALFLMTDKVDGAAELEEDKTGHPPLCLRCAQVARQACPHLSHHCTALRAKKTSICGVFGTPYYPRTGGLPACGAQLVPETEDVFVQYGTRDIKFVLAHQLIRELRRVTLVDLDAELDAAGLGS